jgi:mannose-6-phosphate isomerase-like protein (cupin superfamily)
VTKEDSMKRTLLAVVALASLPVVAADPPGIVIWSAAELKGYAQKLAAKMNEKKLASEQLATFGNHLTMIAHREADGEAEVHDTQADFFVVQSGAATLLLGGEVVGGRTTAPGETRAPSIKGGSKHAISTGDVVHIPAKIPHQLLLPAGKKFDYFVIKVDTP